MQRIAAIKDMLLEGLEKSFKSSLVVNDGEALRQCLRTYGMIDKARDVENLFRDLVVKPFVSEVSTTYLHPSLASPSPSHHRPTDPPTFPAFCSLVVPAVRRVPGASEVTAPRLCL